MQEIKMIFGIGVDICQVSRFSNKINDTKFISRFFNEKEILTSYQSNQYACEYYASRFAAKEAFSKALGTGIRNFELKDVYVKKNDLGKPELKVENTAEVQLQKLVNNPKIHLSISHEKEYAQAFVVIEE